MKAILVFIDGTICDTRQRHTLWGAPAFYQPEHSLKDQPVPGSVDCLGELARHYQLVYMGARPPAAQAATQAWLEQCGFPPGSVYLAETQAGRLALVEELAGQFDFLAGIGDRWDDNELHAALGCLSIILQEYEGEWGAVPQRVASYHRRQKISQNEIHLRGKIEGLARVCPLLLSRYGDGLWRTYFQAVMEMAEASRPERAKEELESFAHYGLNPYDLRDAARWDDFLRQEDWENNPVYGLQDFELVEATPTRYVHKVTRCRYAELWQAHGRPEIGYQIHCHTDQAWWDRPAWNAKVRFEQPQTLMQGDDCCVFIQYLPEE
ncbi:MAG: L-2-amino-thiazoline-4-carboxylic acid hydrolase [Chloroflexota bacterium]